LIYLFYPVLIFYIIKNRKGLKNIYLNKFNHFFIWIAVFPLFLFLLLVIRKQVGLHWVFSFYPFIFIAFSGLLNVKQWRWGFHFMWIFSLVNVIALSSLMLLTVNSFSEKKEAVENLIIGKYPNEVFSQLKQYEKDYQFSTISYGMS